MSATSQHRRQQQRQQPRAVPGHIVNPSIDVSLPVDHAAAENEAFLGERTRHPEQGSVDADVEEKPASRMPVFAIATIGIGAAIVGSGILPF